MIMLSSHSITFTNIHAPVLPVLSLKVLLQINKLRILYKLLINKIYIIICNLSSNKSDLFNGLFDVCNCTIIYAQYFPLYRELAVLDNKKRQNTFKPCYEQTKWRRLSGVAFR